MADCQTSLFDANLLIAGGATSIVLCPNRVYDVGSPVDGNYNTFAGGAPLIVERNGVTIQCGDSGASTNNCVLDGGFAQLLIGDPDNSGTTANDLTIKGLTFTGLMEDAFGGSLAPRAVYATNRATNVLFDDCIFKDMTTGFALDFAPRVSMTVTIQDSVFSNIQHSYDLINADALTAVALSGVTFDQIEHVEPEPGTGKCADAVSVSDCTYTSSIVKLMGPINSLADVTVTDSTFFTAILATAQTLTTPDPLITATNYSIFNEENRTANFEYCGGAYAATYSDATLELGCKRLTSNVDIFEILRCGIDCTQLGEFSTFLTALELTGLNETLAGLGDVTVFAPNNDAFEAAPSGLIEKLIANDTATLTEILRYHITAEDVVLTDAIDIGVPAAQTLQGESLSFTPRLPPRNLYKVDNIEMIETDWGEAPTTGKVVHVINGILSPSTIPLYPSLDELVVELGLSSFVAAASLIEWDPKLELGKDYTVFAPTDEAIANAADVQALLASGSDVNPTVVELLLNHHVVEGLYTMDDLRGRGCVVLTSLAGQNLKITASGDNILLNDKVTNSTSVDERAHNGIVHTIDGVLSVTDNLACSSSPSTASTSFSLMALATVLGSLLLA